MYESERAKRNMGVNGKFWMKCANVATIFRILLNLRVMSGAFNDMDEQGRELDSEFARTKRESWLRENVPRIYELL